MYTAEVVQELHEFDGPVIGYYVKGHYQLFHFMEALDRYGAFDYWKEDYVPQMECINWEWWRWEPTGDPDMPLQQAYPKMVPSQGAFPVTVFWADYVWNGPHAGRLELQAELNRIGNMIPWREVAL